MNNKINEFVEEITDNFSELFVEAFMIRYISNFEKLNDLEFASIVKITKDKLNKKINNRFSKKIADLTK